jgi:hypothetical protein
METRLFLPNDLDSQKKKQGTKPEEGEKKGRPNSYHPESYAAQAEKCPTSRLNNQPGERVPVFERQCEARKSGQPFISTKYGWQDGRKCNGSMEDIFEVGRFWEIHVMPIIHVLVEIFEAPPKSCTE